MRLIKLDAIDSTNDFLKAMARDQQQESLTVVTAERQTKGKGQAGARWESEAGKNLVVSILINNSVESVNDIYLLNMAVSVAILNVLKPYQVHNFSVKWPNDIMAGDSKIGGILIENSIRSNGLVDSVIGIGLNVNQSDFSNLPKATSLLQVTGNELSREEILSSMVTEIENAVHRIKTQQQMLVESYTSNLYKKDIAATFQCGDSAAFNGIIRGIDNTGLLIVELEDQSVRSFALKEITMLY